jgi:hypothetical protein
MFIFCWLHVTKLIHTTGKHAVVNNCPADTTDPDEQLQQKKLKEKSSQSWYARLPDEKKSSVPGEAANIPQTKEGCRSQSECG